MTQLRQMMLEDLQRRNYSDRLRWTKRNLYYAPRLDYPTVWTFWLTLRANKVLKRRAAGSRSAWVLASEHD